MKYSIDTFLEISYTKYHRILYIRPKTQETLKQLLYPERLKFSINATHMNDLEKEYFLKQGRSLRVTEVL